RQHDDRTGGPERHCLAGKLHKRAAQAVNPKTTRENRQGFPAARQRETEFIEGGIDPGVDFQQLRRLRSLALYWLERIVHRLPANTVRAELETFPRTKLDCPYKI